MSKEKQKKKGKYWVKIPWIKDGWYYTKNLNPYNNKVGDCAIRAIMAFSKCTSKSSWYRIYSNLFALAVEKDTNSRNKDIIKELLDKTLETEIIIDPYKGKKSYDPELDKQISIKDFMKQNPTGNYFVILYRTWSESHALCIRDKVICDYNTNYNGEEKIVWAAKEIKKR